TAKPSIMGVKRDNVPFAGVHEGTESPNKVAKEAKRTFAAGLDLLSLKQNKPPPKNRSKAPTNHGTPAVYFA
ncbi:MAG: hypothetical protein IKQ90_05915, partial [Ruminococcus sp.]|nr:hypothetical protein [Ruminococcus sp.]